MNRRYRAMLWVVLSSCLLCACANVCAGIRKHTYPPNFGYIESADLHEAMWRLAYNVNEIDVIVRSPRSPSEADRQAILKHLTEMESAAKALQADTGATNHPIIRDHLGHFQRDVALARRGLEATPPSYVMAGYVSGACLVCHGETD